ncbi:hypothetical protein V500_02756 [Pseudogymnoascus sp. VKM F-4518 (FW-2643)]|nr:hypothetical protein V500_02756 [Pseudogymnoascus sp. VKM F-4518 (FW-2643)]
MLDADQGDCHVVDLCVVKPEPNNSYPTTGHPSYTRVIIDTGPNSKHCLQNLINVLKTYGQPTLEMVGGGMSWPKFWDEAFVSFFESGYLALYMISYIPPNMTTCEADFTPTLEVLNKFVAQEKNPGLEWILQHQNAGFRLVYNFKVQLMLNVNDPVPSWGDTALFEWKSENNKRQIDLYQSQCQPSTGNRFGAACVTCHLTIERQRKVGKTTKKKGNATAFVEIEMPNAVVQKGFVVSKQYILLFKNPADPNERASFIGPFPKEAPTEPPLTTIKDFYLIRLALDKLEAAALEAAALNPDVTRLLIKAPRDLAIQGENGIHFFYPSLAEVTCLHDSLLLGGKYDWYRQNMSIVGPLKGIYHDLIGDSMSAFYESANIMTKSPDPGNYDIANRASIVTLFTRTSDKFPSKIFKMLFTGDAYDRDCNVAGTVQAFVGQQLPIMVDVLKVPHHGSDVTADAEFYRLIRAQIYLISGKQTRNGSPSLKTLKAIASGFRGEPGSWRPTANAAYLFFSDATTLDNVLDQPSNSAQLLSSEVKPNRANNGAPVYNYYCYCLKKGRTEKDRTAGRILFGAGDQGQCWVYTSSNEWNMGLNSDAITTSLCLHLLCLQIPAPIIIPVQHRHACAICASSGGRKCNVTGGSPVLKDVSFLENHTVRSFGFISIVSQVVGLGRMSRRAKKRDTNNKNSAKNGYLGTIASPASPSTAGQAAFLFLDWGQNWSLVEDLE